MAWAAWPHWKGRVHRELLGFKPWGLRADRRAAVRRRVDVLAPDGRLVLIDGHWYTGAGLGVDQVRALVRPVGRVVDTRELSGSSYWGKETHDERFLLIAQVTDTTPRGRPERHLRRHE